MIDFLQRLASELPVAYAVLMLSATIVGGLAIGSIRLKGIRLGSAGVLFAGIALSHFGARIDPKLAEFIREFGLALFVFMIGLQLGRGFFESLKREGLRLNLLAVAVVLAGTGCVLAMGHLLGVQTAARFGLLSGATTNTPSLAAAQQSMRMLQVEDEIRELTPMAYAVAYPLGIAGVIAALWLLRAMCKADPVAEAAELDREQNGYEAVERWTLVVENPNLEGIQVSELPAIRHLGVQISRIQKRGSTSVGLAHGSTVIGVGDHITAVGSEEELVQLTRTLGRRVETDLTSVPADLEIQRMIVTRASVAGKTLAELSFGKRFAVKVTRLARGDIELAASGQLRLQFGDVLSVLGTGPQLAEVSAYVGNSRKALDETHFLPVFLGIAAGVVLGTIPISVPGLTEAVRLGMAGGPLIVAVILGRVGQIGPLVWHVPRSAQLALRELGITLFLACVGLKAGEHFVEMAASERGLKWIAVAGVAAVVPPVLVGLVARRVLKLNYAKLAGVLAGSVTDPPALAFANGMCRSEAPSLSYATVYPLTMVARIVVMQVLVLMLAS